MWKHIRLGYMLVSVSLFSVDFAAGQIIGKDLRNAVPRNAFPGYDMTLNAPYRGPIKELFNACIDIPFGEGVNLAIPLEKSPNIRPDYSIKVWHVEGVSGLYNFSAWDRNVIRLYTGVDDSGTEIVPGTGDDSLGGGPDYEPNAAQDPDCEYLDTGLYGQQVFSIRAIATDSLVPKTFRLRFFFDQYGTGGG